ncbi:MAG: hypothetical protein QM764_16100 [Chitinophagaceae bacterium]
MNFNILIQNEAVVETQQIFEDYEKKKDGLGFDFIESVERALHELSQGANYYRFIDTKKKYRRILLDRFPCMIIYEIETDTVFILSVRYERENPSKRKKFTK